MATMDDIAKRLGISKGTVSKAFSGAGDISEAMRRAVLETAVELGYTRLPRFLLTGAHDHSGFRNTSVSTMPSTEQIAAVTKENALPTAVKNGQSTDTMPQPVITMP